MSVCLYPLQVQRRQGFSHWSQQERDAMARHLEQIKRQRQQNRLALLERQQKELQRRLAQAAAAASGDGVVSSYWTVEELEAMKQRQAQLQEESRQAALALNSPTSEGRRHRRRGRDSSSSTVSVKHTYISGSRWFSSGHFEMTKFEPTILTFTKLIAILFTNY